MIRFVLVLTIVGFASQPATADPAAADRLATEAKAAFASNEFKTAAAKFAAAYKEDPSRPELFCNIGISYFKASDLPRAHLLLQQCLERSALDLTFKDNAKAVLAAIEQTLRTEKHTPVTIRVVPQGATAAVVEFGAESSFAGARTIWLAFGKHHLEVRAEGYTTRTVPIETTDQNPKTVDITLDKEAPPPPPKPTPKPTAPTKLLPIATTVVTAGAIVLAVVAFGKGREAADRSPFALDLEAFDDDQAEVTKWNTVMGMTGAFAVVGAAASTYLWIRATRSTRVEMTPTGGGASMVLRGRF